MQNHKTNYERYAKSTRCAQAVPAPSREGGGIFLGGTWHFWLNENVGTTSQVLRGAAKRIHTHKHTHRQAGALTHTKACTLTYSLELPPPSPHASEKCWRQAPLKNLMNEVDTFFFRCCCVLHVPHPNPCLPTLFVRCARLKRWPESRLKCIHRQRFSRPSPNLSISLPACCLLS